GAAADDAAVVADLEGVARDLQELVAVGLRERRVGVAPDADRVAHAPEPGCALRVEGIPDGVARRERLGEALPYADLLRVARQPRAVDLLLVVEVAAAGEPQRGSRDVLERDPTGL